MRETSLNLKRKNHSEDQDISNILHICRPAPPCDLSAPGVSGDQRERWQPGRQGETSGMAVGVVADLSPAGMERREGSASSHDDLVKM